MRLKLEKNRAKRQLGREEMNGSDVIRIGRHTTSIIGSFLREYTLRWPCGRLWIQVILAANLRQQRHSSLSRQPVSAAWPASLLTFLYGGDTGVKDIHEADKLVRDEGSAAWNKQTGRRHKVNALSPLREPDDRLYSGPQRLSMLNM